MEQPPVPRDKPSILIVDDTPANIDLLVQMLEERDYLARTAASGKQALQAAREDPPDLILLDINMPEMNGYEVCERLKADDQLAEIPVLFISALSETMDKVKAFAVGGVDYITKPFQFEEVHARVETHLKLREVQSQLKLQNVQLQESYGKLRELEEQERELLDRTFRGAISLLTQILQVAKPQAFGRSSRVARRMLDLAHGTGRPDLEWEFEMAGMLSQIGCVIVPDDILDKVASGTPLDTMEATLYAKHPKVAQELLLKIPRLERLGEIVAVQEEHPERGSSAAGEPSPEDSSLTARALQMVIELDGLVSSGKPVHKALNIIQSRASYYDATMIKALAQSAGTETHRERIAVNLIGLQANMILAEDVVSEKGVTLVKKGQEVTPVLRHRLTNLARSTPVREPLHVWVVPEAQ